MGIGVIKIGSEEYAKLQCCDCGAVFYVPNVLDEKAQQDKRDENNPSKAYRSIYCPNGHGLSYRISKKKEKEETPEKEPEVYDSEKTPFPFKDIFKKKRKAQDSTEKSLPADAEEDPN